MFGDLAHSALFTTLREKEGLIYSISSEPDVFTGLLEVYAELKNL